MTSTKNYLNLKENLMKTLTYEQYLNLAKEENELLEEMRYHCDEDLYHEVRARLDCVKTALNYRVGVKM